MYYFKKYFNKIIGKSVTMEVWRGKVSLYPIMRSVFMSKGLSSKKNQRKKPTMTLKERRQKKHEKKQHHATDFHHEDDSSTVM